MEVPEVALTPSYPVRILPRSAWVINVFGLIPLAAIVVAVILAGRRANGHDTAEAFVFAVALLGFLIIVLRPPGARLYEDEIVIREFLRRRRIPRTAVQDILVAPCRLLNGQPSSSTNRDIFIVASVNGLSVQLPIMWCHKWFGAFNAGEAEQVDATLKAWIGRPLP